MTAIVTERDQGEGLGRKLVGRVVYWNGHRGARFLKMRDASMTAPSLNRRVTRWSGRPVLT